MRRTRPRAHAHNARTTRLLRANCEQSASESFGHIKTNSYLCTHGTNTTCNHRHRVRLSPASVHKTPQAVKHTHTHDHTTHNTKRGLPCPRTPAATASNVQRISVGARRLLGALPSFRVRPAGCGVPRSLSGSYGPLAPLALVAVAAPRPPLCVRVSPSFALRFRARPSLHHR